MYIQQVAMIKFCGSSGRERNYSAEFEKGMSCGVGMIAGRRRAQMERHARDGPRNDGSRSIRQGDATEVINGAIAVVFGSKVLHMQLSGDMALWIKNLMRTTAF